MEQEGMDTTMKEQIVSTLLRLPSVFMLEFLYHNSEIQLLKENVFTQKELVKNLGIDIHILSSCIQYIGYLVVIALIALPVHHLKSLYTHLITFMLLMVSKRLSRDYITLSQDSDSQHIYQDAVSLQRMIGFSMKQGVLVLICTSLMRTKRHWIFSAFLAPIIVRTFCLEPRIAETTHMVSCWFTAFIVANYLAGNISFLWNLAAHGLTELNRMIQEYSVTHLILLVYRKAFSPSIYVCFWVCLFIFHFLSYIDYKDSNFNFKDRWLVMIFAMIADSCESPWSLIGLCYVVSYTAYFIHSGCRIYLVGFNGHVQDHALYTGSIEGITLFILAVQTGLLDLNRIEKIFSLSIVLFIVASSMLQSLYEMTNPVLLLLSTSNNNKVLAHIRVLIFVFILIIIPIVMTYQLNHVFNSNIWILIISLSCLLTSLHTFGSLMVYALFMIDNFRKEPWENLDDVVYCIHGFSHALEFVVAVCGVCFGGFDAVFSDLSIGGSSIILLHFYFNVWQSAKSGWESVKRRRGAMQKINILKNATKEELESLNDVCAICYEKMTSARVTPCSHYFHGACLKKWLYVKDKCPMCHSSIIENNKNLKDFADTGRMSVPATEAVNTEQRIDRVVRLRNSSLTSNADTCTNVAGTNARTATSVQTSSTLVEEQSTNVVDTASSRVEEPNSDVAATSMSRVEEPNSDVAATSMQTSNVTDEKSRTVVAETLMQTSNCMDEGESNVVAAATSLQSSDATNENG